MKKTNISHLFFTLALGSLLVGCGGGTEYDTSRDFTKLEATTNPTFEQRANANVKEVDILAEQYRVDNTNKNINVDNSNVDNSNVSYNKMNASNNTVNEDPNAQIGTMPVANPSLPPVVDNNTNTQVIPEGEVNVISDSNANH